MTASAASRSYGVRLAPPPYLIRIEVQNVVLRWGFKKIRRSPPGWQMIYKKEPGRSKTPFLFAAPGSSCFYAGEQSSRIVVRHRTPSTLQLGLLVLGGAPRVVWHLGRSSFSRRRNTDRGLFGLCALRWPPKIWRAKHILY